MNLDPATNKSKQLVPFMDSLWARYFEQVYPMAPFTTDFLNRMMLVYADYFNQTLAGNETTNKLFVTGVLSEVVTRFQTRVAIDKANTTSDEDILKFYFYSDHDDSITTLSTALSNHLPSYPPFASQIIFELWRTNSSLYEVKLRINDVEVPMSGACNLAQECGMS